VWAFDEHRAGLKPVPRRIWAPKGRRPVATGRPRYEWLYLYGFVHPTSGAVEWFLCNAVNTALFAAVLARFAAAVGAGVDKTVILVLDNAGWHGGGGGTLGVARGPPARVPAALFARAATGGAALAAHQ
jgi:DDE superfamily endonuclease